MKNLRKNYDGWIVVGKKLGCCHCAKAHSINVKGIHVSVKWGNCNVKASGKIKQFSRHLLEKK